MHRASGAHWAAALGGGRVGLGSCKRRDRAQDYAQHDDNHGCSAAGQDLSSRNLLQCVIDLIGYRRATKGSNGPMSQIPDFAKIDFADTPGATAAPAAPWLT